MTSLKSSKTYSFVYSKVYLIKATIRLFYRLRKTLKYKNCLNFKKTAFDVLVFHHASKIGCVPTVV